MKTVKQITLFGHVKFSDVNFFVFKHISFRFFI